MAAVLLFFAAPAPLTPPQVKIWRRKPTQNARTTYADQWICQTPAPGAPCVPLHVRVTGSQNWVMPFLRGVAPRATVSNFLIAVAIAMKAQTYSHTQRTTLSVTIVLASHSSRHSAAIRKLDTVQTDVSYFTSADRHVEMASPTVPRYHAIEHSAL